jgi:hypothetical protein
MQLGITARDRITGFQGVVTGYCQYISGCEQALLIPTVGPDGALRGGEWFDIQRLERVGDDIVVLDNGSTPGPDKPAPIR